MTDVSAAKTLTMEGLAALRARLRDTRIVLCHGAFDLIHLGHLIHFEEAKRQGDILVVTLTGDQHIKKKRSVSFSETDRLRQVAALQIVDYVAIVQEPSAVAAIEALKPDVYVKGPEYSNLLLDKTSNIFREKALVESYGGRLYFTEGDTFSSTKLSHFLLASPEGSQSDPLLRNDRVLFRDVSSLGFKLEDIKAFLVEASKLRVCLLGETIVDEWVDVEVMSLSQKSRCIAGLETARLSQVGGAGMIALHLADFVKDVHIVTNDLAGPLPANVTVTRLSDSPLVKTRFVDGESRQPLFEAKRLTLTNVRHDDVPNFDDYDVVLLADYGHGLLDAKRLNPRIAAAKSAYVTAMAQVNSANYGYHLPTRYTGADYYSVNRTEAELCLQERDLPIADVLARLSALLACPSMSVTDGEDGVMVRAGEDRAQLPALSTTVVDTIGCGDAYFSLSSLAAALGLPAKLIGLAGSIGAAAVSQRRCNERAVSEQEFLTIAKIVI